MTSTLVRLPRDMEREIREVQNRFKAMGIDISFPQAAKEWRRLKMGGEWRDI